MFAFGGAQYKKRTFLLSRRPLPITITPTFLTIESYFYKLGVDYTNYISLEKKI